MPVSWWPSTSRSSREAELPVCLEMMQYVTNCENRSDSASAASPCWSLKSSRCPLSIWSFILLLAQPPANLKKALPLKLSAIDRVPTQQLFDAQKLIVLRHAVG